MHAQSTLLTALVFTILSFSSATPIPNFESNVKSCLRFICRLGKAEGTQEYDEVENSTVEMGDSLPTDATIWMNTAQALPSVTPAEPYFDWDHWQGGLGCRTRDAYSAY
jgi:hypothetical protein